MNNIDLIISHYFHKCEGIIESMTLYEPNIYIDFLLTDKSIDYMYEFFQQHLEIDEDNSRYDMISRKWLYKKYKLLDQEEIDKLKYDLEHFEPYQSAIVEGKLS